MMGRGKLEVPAMVSARLSIAEYIDTKTNLKLLGGFDTLSELGRQLLDEQPMNADERSMIEFWRKHQMSSYLRTSRPWPSRDAGCRRGYGLQDGGGR